SPPPVSPSRCKAGQPSPCGKRPCATSTVWSIAEKRLSICSTRGAPGARRQFNESCVIGVPSATLSLMALSLYQCSTPPDVLYRPRMLPVITDWLMRMVEDAPLEKIPILLFADGRAVDHDIERIAGNGADPVHVGGKGAVPHGLGSHAHPA